MNTTTNASGRIGIGATAKEIYLDQVGIADAGIGIDAQRNVNGVGL